MFTNTFRALVESGELLQMARGIYRKGGSGSMKEKVAGILKKSTLIYVQVGHHDRFKGTPATVDFDNLKMICQQNLRTGDW